MTNWMLDNEKRIIIILKNLINKDAINSVVC
jgi:hypothetical protein